MTVLGYEDLWDSYWKELVTHEDGTLNLEAVKRELADFHFMLNEVPRVYEAVTGGMLSKPHYWANSVVTEFEHYVEQLHEYAITDFLSEHDIEDPRKEETND